MFSLHKRTATRIITSDPFEEGKPREAEKTIARQRQLIARQRQLIELQRARKENSATAQSLLSAMQYSLKVLSRHLRADRLRAKIDGASAEKLARSLVEIRVQNPRDKLGDRASLR